MLTANTRRRLELGSGRPAPGTMADLAEQSARPPLRAVDPDDEPAPYRLTAAGEVALYEAVPPPRGEDASPEDEGFPRTFLALSSQPSPQVTGLISLSSLSSQQEGGWPALGEDALYGLAGTVVRTLDPHTESDPVGVLLTFLTAFGNLVGPGPHAVADGSDHPARLNVALVGDSARARKGTSWANVRRILTEADPQWLSSQVLRRLASGEALIAAVADDEDSLTVPDRRALVLEPEFARLLAVSAREGSTLSANIRDAWDSGDLAVRTRDRTTTLKATGAHVSVVAHITADELRRRLTDTDAVNGFANRFLFACVRRSKLLPNGGSPDAEALSELARRVDSALSAARRVVLVRRSPAAEELWAVEYKRWAESEPPGMVGAVTARADANTLRLSVCYALLDGSPVVEVEHLRAAFAVWDYCERSASRLFGERLGDPIADRLLDALRQAGPRGLTADEQYRALGGHVSRAALDQARRLLERVGKAVTVRQATGGRPRTVNIAAEHARKAR